MNEKIASDLRINEILIEFKKVPNQDLCDVRMNDKHFCFIDCTNDSIVHIRTILASFIDFGL